jgi:hypothetical protein
MRRESNPALIVRLKGGLGNQLFEYASGRAIANRNGVPLYLDVESGFLQDPFKRSFALGSFGVSAKCLTRQEALALAPPALKTQYLRRREIIRMNWLSEYHDPVLHSIRVRKPILLDNYLQSPLYFMDCAATIRSELGAKRLHQFPSGADSACSQDTVCVHSRRFPDLALAGVGPAVQQYYGAYGIDYYRASMQIIRTERPGAKFYLFGDDPAWMRNNILPICPDGKVIDTGSALADFQMMLQCTHFVISNSTFGWWAAWLGHKDNSIVFCGASWNQGERKPPRNLLPPAWRKL